MFFILSLISAVHKIFKRLICSVSAIPDVFSGGYFTIVLLFSIVKHHVQASLCYQETSCF